MDDKNILESIAKIDKVVIRHPSFDRAMQGIEECLIRSKAYSEPIGCLLSGDGGYGKTTLCKVIMQKMPIRTINDGLYEKTIIPAFYCSVPSPSTIKSIAAALLAQLNDPSPLAGTTAHMTKRLCHLLKECETKLIFLDEFHHLFNTQTSSKKINTDVCNWIKSLVNSTSICICLVGLLDFTSFLSIDTQLSRRFPLHFKLTPLTAGTKDEGGNLEPFLTELFNKTHHKLEIRFTIDPTNTHTTHQLYLATKGNPAFLMSLIKESMVVALRQNRAIITIDDFNSAWETGITAKSSITKENPFKMSPGILAKFLRG